jgi:uncharacterized protein (DUF433 family)
MNREWELRDGTFEKGTDTAERLDHSPAFGSTLPGGRGRPSAALTASLTRDIFRRMGKTGRGSTGGVELGRHIVADPAICHGKPTFKGTRVFVADVLADVERGLSWDFIVQRWGSGKITKAAVTEAVRLAREALLREDGQLVSVITAA